MDGTVRTYWGSSRGVDGMCSCGVTGMCDQPDVNCNCNIKDGVQRQVRNSELRFTILDFCIVIGHVCVTDVSC